MAEKTDTYLVDDVTGETLYDEPGTTVKWTHGKDKLEFDASSATEAAFIADRGFAIEAFNVAVKAAGDVYNERMAPYVTASRKSGKKRKTSATGKLTVPSEDRKKNERIRQAAKDAGVEINARGRIPGNVRAQFSDA